MRIFLIGYMGSGKTTIGKKLAEQLDYEFVDLDQFIEEGSATTISQIFKEKGEDYFRRLEERNLDAMCMWDDVIVSTGGGLPCYKQNMDTINDLGMSVYLKMEPKDLAARIENDKGGRPLLEGKSGQELVDFIEGHLAERELHYSKATKTVDGVELEVSELLSAVGEYL